MPRRAIALFILLLGALTAALFATWFVAAGIAETQVEEWTAREARLGRAWTCGSFETSGFPLEVIVRCDQPRLVARNANSPSFVAMSSATARASVLNPWRIEAHVVGPAQATLNNGRQMSVSWRDLNLMVSITGKGPDIAISGSKIEVQTTGFGAEWKSVDVAGVAARARPVPDRAAGSGVWEVVLDVFAAQVEQLDQMIGNDAPADLRVTAHVSEFEPRASGPLLARIEDWRRAGGRLSIIAASAKKGASRGEATGVLSLDEQRRPTGRINAQVAGIEPLLKQFGLGAGAMAIESLVRGMFSRPAPDLEQRSAPAFIRLPVIFQNGRVSIGPLKTPIVLRGLY